MRRKLCRPSKHVWRKTRAGHEVCIQCGTRFPCRAPGCGHADCHEHRGEPPPSIVVAIDGVPTEHAS